MGNLARASALTGALALALTTCGDPIVIVGDSPGTLRIVVGIPEEPGDSLGASARESMLDTPRGLATADDGTVYIADTENARVLALLPDGGIAVVVDEGLRTPDALALDGVGGLLIADRFGQRILRVDLATGEVEPIAGNGTRGTSPDSIDALEAELAEPSGVAIGPGGRVYFTEMSNHRVRRVEPDGVLVTVAGRGFPGFAGDDGPARQAILNQPTGLAFGEGVLYVADGGNNRIRAIALGDSTIATVAGVGTPGFAGDGGPATHALLDAPSALTVTNNGAVLYIADTGNHRIRAINLATGRISTFAGTGTEGFNGDLLPAGATALSAPRGVAASVFDLLYISDSGHHIVRRTPIAFVGSP